MKFSKKRLNRIRCEIQVISFFNRYKSEGIEFVFTEKIAGQKEEEEIINGKKMRLKPVDYVTPHVIFLPEELHAFFTRLKNDPDFSAWSLDIFRSHFIRMFEQWSYEISKGIRFEPLPKELDKVGKISNDEGIFLIHALAGAISCLQSWKPQRDE